MSGKYSKIRQRSRTWNLILGIIEKAQPSINTEKDGVSPAEFKSPERDGADNRINAELVIFQTFYNNRVADKKTQ